MNGATLLSSDLRHRGQNGACVPRQIITALQVSESSTLRPAGAYFFFGGLALLSAAGDVRMLLRGGVSGRQRLVRHLWRMCFGWFIATISFFLGQQQVFPQWLQGSNILLVLAFLPLILLSF
jgi:hypothetical protein